MNKIKSEIWTDRLNFLQKIIKLQEESKQDQQSPEVQALPALPVPQATAAPTVAGKAQALAQESEAASINTMKLQDDDEEANADAVEEPDKKVTKRDTSKSCKKSK